MRSYSGSRWAPNQPSYSAPSTFTRTSNIPMPPRLQLPRIGQAIAFRQRPSISRLDNTSCQRLAPSRSITADEKPLPIAEDQSQGLNQGHLPHVSEEAAAIGEITGEGGPDIGQGTPVQEVKPITRSRGPLRAETDVLFVDFEARRRSSGEGPKSSPGRY